MTLKRKNPPDGGFGWWAQYGPVNAARQRYAAQPECTWRGRKKRPANYFDGASLNRVFNAAQQLNALTEEAAAAAEEQFPDAA